MKKWPFPRSKWITETWGFFLRINRHCVAISLAKLNSIQTAEVMRDVMEAKGNKGEFVLLFQAVNNTNVLRLFILLFVHCQKTYLFFFLPSPLLVCRPLWCAASGRWFGETPHRWRRPRQCLWDKNVEFDCWFFQSNWGWGCCCCCPQTGDGSNEHHLCLIELRLRSQEEFVRPGDQTRIHVRPVWLLSLRLSRGCSWTLVYGTF